METAMYQAEKKQSAARKLAGEMLDLDVIHFEDGEDEMMLIAEIEKGAGSYGIWIKASGDSAAYVTSASTRGMRLRAKFAGADIVTSELAAIRFAAGLAYNEGLDPNRRARADAMHAKEIRPLARKGITMLAHFEGVGTMYFAGRNADGDAYVGYVSGGSREMTVAEFSGGLDAEENLLAAIERAALLMAEDVIEQSM